jgi:hypothetical protein
LPELSWICDVFGQFSELLLHHRCISNAAKIRKH